MRREKHHNAWKITIKKLAGLVFQREQHLIKRLESMGGEAFQAKWKYMCMMETG